MIEKYVKGILFLPLVSASVGSLRQTVKSGSLSIRIDSFFFAYYTGLKVVKRFIYRRISVVLAGDLRKGTKILHKGDPYSVVDYQHVKPGKGGAYMRTKMKNLITGNIQEETFRSEEKLETPNLEFKDMLYIYEEDGLYQFLDQETYEQIAFHKDQLSDVLDYLLEQTVYNVLYFDGRAIAVNPPVFLSLKVIETPPGVKGDTAQGGGTKPATLETGLVIQVPLFVNEGNVIKVDTREGKYIERLDTKK